MAEVSGEQVTKTGISMNVSDARALYLPTTRGNCLDVGTSGDYVGSVNFAWGTTGYACFFRANIRSTPSSAARLITNSGDEIMLTVFGIKTQHNGASVTSNNVLIYNQWHEYGVVWDGTYVRYYRDGVVISNNYFTTPPSGTANDYYIFNRSDGLRQCDMQVANLHWYNKSFQPDEVIKHYRQTPEDTQNLVFYYRFNEGTGATATDSSGNSLNASITGCSWTTYSLPNSIYSYYGATSIASLRSAVGNQSVLLNSGRNIIENPSFENNAAWWSASGGATITRLTNDAAFGTCCARIDTNGVDGFTAIRMGATPTYENHYRGRRFVFSVYAKAGTLSKMSLEYSKSSNTVATFDLTSTWTRYTISGIVPNNSTTQAVYVYAGQRGVSGAPGNIYVDGITLQYFESTLPSSAYPQDYLDGTQANCSWEGTAGSSKSKRTVTDARVVTTGRVAV